MARIRQVKPELFRHEELFALEQHSALPVRLAFIGLWTVVDREGRFRWRPREIKLDVMPYDDIDFEQVLNALASKHFVVSYIVAGEKYGFIPSWRKHQTPHVKEKSSLIPAPDKTGANTVLEPDSNRFSTPEYGIRNTEYIDSILKEKPSAKLVRAPVSPHTALSQDPWQRIKIACRPLYPTDSPPEDFDWLFDSMSFRSLDSDTLWINSPNHQRHLKLAHYRTVLEAEKRKFGVRHIKFWNLEEDKPL